MDLFFHEFIHLLVSLFIGFLLYYRYHKRQLIFLSLFVGIFIDLDHLIDYFISVDFTYFSLVEFLTIKWLEETNKIYVLFHGWEFVLILLFLAERFKKYQPVLLTVALAIFSHLLVDQFNFLFQGYWVLGYSFIYRLIHNFSYSSFIGI